MMEPCSANQRIGIIGGSFDPLHLGHLIIAQDAAEYLDLSRVLFIPAANPPHKQHLQQADAEHRLAMLRQALAADRRFYASDIELQREGLSYTVDTIHELRIRHPDAALFLIIGSDTLLELHTWHRYEELLEQCSVATMLRPGIDSPELISRSIRVDGKYRERLLRHIIEAHRIDISSTEVRRRISEEKDISYLVPPSVVEYINTHDLYRESTA